MKLTGERVTTAAAAFNPTWQRHVAAYRLCGPLLARDPVLEVGCGIGHSHQLLGGCQTIGLDLHFDSLRRQGRPVVQADMRTLPIRNRSVSSVLSIQSLEHVPNPKRVVAEAARVLSPDGTAVFVTPNRLTFGLADEIVDPWHYVECDQAELRLICESSFGAVDLLGIFGTDRYLAFQAQEKRKLHRLLRLDPLRLRRRAPRRARQWIYNLMLRRFRQRGDESAAAISIDDFFLGDADLDCCLDLVAVCNQPIS